MRILHLLPPTDAAIAHYVAILTDQMGLEVENHKATTADEARQLLRTMPFDILHVHGCWNNAQFSVVRRALTLGARLVVTPYGQLQPWEQQRHFWKEKLPKRIAYQQTVVRQAYAVIVQGKMELECIRQLGWNNRCIIIRNALITNSITPHEMARQTFDVYQRIMDSNPLLIMNDNTLRFVKRLITIGITGDERWLTGEEVPMLGDWRQILCYAHQEQIMPTILRAVRILNLMPVALRGSQRGVHTVCYFGPIRPFVVPFIAGTKTKMADFSPKYTAIFPPNKPFVTFSSPYVTFFSSLWSGGLSLLSLNENLKNFKHASLRIFSHSGDRGPQRSGNSPLDVPEHH